MKIILSRKGFDSAAGGAASPILPDGVLVSLPIPDPEAPYAYHQIHHGQHNLGSLAAQLTKGRVRREDRAHLDPDLLPQAVPRARCWRPLFGQSGTALSHLQGQKVGVGDLFLFFGWFRQTRLDDGVLRYERHAPDQHLFFGWLQIGGIVDLNHQAPEPWMAQHPHCFGSRGKNNMIYVAASKTGLSGLPADLPGAGLFPNFHPSLVLTAPGASRRFWRLPLWFHPQGRASQLTYHKPESWQSFPDHLLLKSAGRGQEFVLDCDHYPEAPGWAADLIETGLGAGPPTNFGAKVK